MRKVFLPIKTINIGIFVLYLFIQNVNSNLSPIPYVREIVEIGDWVEVKNQDINQLHLEITEEKIREGNLQILFFRVDGFPDNPPRIENYRTPALDFFQLSTNHEEEEDEGYRLFGLELYNVLDREGQLQQYEMLFFHGPSLLLITIDIKDVNDNDPRFGPGGPFTIKENCAENCNPMKLNFDSRDFNVFEFKGTDPDIDDIPLLQFSVTENGESGPSYNFGIETQIDIINKEAIGNFSIIGKLDYEFRAMHQVVVNLTDGERNFFQTVTIHVQDEPDELPIWRRLPLVTTVEENTEIKVLFKVEAVDGDRGFNSPILYSMKGIKDDGNEDPRILEYFALDENTGDFSIIQPFDAEHEDFINNLALYIDVTATEKEYPHDLITESITVNIRDVNDNSPVFDSSGTSFETFEIEMNEACTDASNVDGCFTGTFLNLPKPFVIKDMDTALNYGSYDVKIEGEAFIHEALEIIPTRGSQLQEFQISVKDRAKLDFEDNNWQNPVEFKVLIEELADSTHKAEATVIITLNDLNDNVPNFEDTENGEYKLPVRETVKTGDIIRTVFAKDNDISQEFGQNSVRYSWHINSRAPPLDINSITGEITVSKDNAFDFESFSEEVFIIEAKDSQGEALAKSSSAILRLTIEDVNDENPQLVLPSYRTEIFENSKPGEPGEDVLLYIIASDRDKDADLEITFRVIDIPPSWTEDPRRVCDPVQEPPEDLSLWFLKSERPIPIEGNSEVRVEVNITVGNVQADREYLDRVEVEITVCDKNQTIGNTCNSQIFSVEIKDVNDNCPFFSLEQQFQFEVSETEYFTPGEDKENDYQREIIRRLQFDDRDLNSNFTFEINSSYPGMDVLVDIDFQQGVVRRKLNEMIDRERQDFYNGDTDLLHYNYIVSDQEHKVSQSVIIEVIDINDNDPIFTNENETTVKVLENTEGDVPLWTLLATDKDSIERYGKVNYVFSLRNVVGNDEFEIDLNTGVLTAKRSLIDRERFSSFDLILEAVDSYPAASGRRATFNARIEVIDVNDNAPEFLTSNEKTLRKVSEVEGELGESLAVIQLFDKDDPLSSNSEIVVELVRVECNRFEVDPSSIFGIYQNVSLVDGRNLTDVHILKNETFTDLFGIYKLFFEAKDLGEGDNVTENSYTIEITDVNNNAPEFIDPNEECLFSELETIPSDGFRFIGEFSLRDKDEPNEPNSEISVQIRSVTCDNLKVTELMNLFQLLCYPSSLVTTCTFVANNDFRNRWGNYNITLRAVDRGNPVQSTEMSYCVQILDVNINEPEFITSSEGFLNSVFETDMANGKAFENIIFITDQDEHNMPNSDLNVSLIKSECEVCNKELCPNNDRLFNITTQKTANGSFETTILATQEFTNCYGIYSLEFEAEDSGEIRLKSNKTYRIEVKDVNLHRPIFVWPADGTRVNILLENEVGNPIEDNREVLIQNVHATDNDSPTSPNGRLSLEIIPDGGEFPSNEYFGFKNEGGIQRIYLIKALEHDDHLGYNFNSIIRASDAGEPDSFSTEVNLIIHIVSKNNTAPFFTQYNDTLTFRENQTDIQEFSIPPATDPDFATDTNNDIVYYHITGPDKDFFELIPSEAENATVIPKLRAKEIFDREEKDLYIIQLYVSNSRVETPVPPGENHPNSYLPITIEIEDIIDTAPVFDDVIDNLISAGFSDSTKAQSNIYMFKASDVEFQFGDHVSFEIEGEIKGSTENLDAIREKLRLVIETDEGEGDEKRARANLQLAFDALTTYDGHFSFTIKANDSANMITLIPVEMYIFHDSHIVIFNFRNERSIIEQKKTQLAEILGSVFSYRCNIDRIASEGSSNQTSVHTHFVGAGLVDSLKIQEMQLDSETLNKLYQELAKEDFSLDFLSYKNPDIEEEDNLMTYILIGGCAVLGTVLAIMSVTCWYHSRGLSRKVRALTATFGSESSDVNRAGTGGVDLVPGTNVHAIQGSNPVYSRELETKNPAFDTESIGSGGSVLIGVEDDEDFKNYEEDDDNQMPSAPHGRNPLFEDEDIDFIDMPSTNAVRRNPLMNLDIDPISGQDESDT